LRRAFSLVKAINDDRGYQHWAGIHGYPLPAYCDFAHGHPAYFLPWHRAYLYFVEHSLQAQVPGVTLAWWDWTATAGAQETLPAAFTAATDPSGQPNPLLDADINAQAIAQGQQRGDPRTSPTTRAPGLPGTVPLPSSTRIDAIIAKPHWTDFTNALEQVHGEIHVWVGGHMSDIGFASYDPIFWAHHTMIDRIWQLWQLKWGGTPPAAALDQALPPFAMTTRQTLDINALGYDYASSTAHAPTPGPGGHH
jgi:tyrosinase